MNEKIVRKWFWVWEFEKEEKWLDAMARDGWVLDSVGFCKYGFKRCAPGAYQTRLELLNWDPQTPEGQAYIQFVEDTGAEYVGHYVRWAYFRKKAENGAFDLFSDVDSRIRHLRGIMNMVGIIGSANLLIGCSVIGNGNGMGWINVGCAALLGYALVRLNQMRRRLKAERQLHE